MFLIGLVILLTLLETIYNRFTYTCITRYPSGQLEYYGTEKQSMFGSKYHEKHGPCINWYNNGVIKSIIKYDNDIITEERWWYPDGNIRKVWNKSKCDLWHLNGNKCCEYNYADSKIDGQYKYWNRRGILLLHHYYIQGQLYWDMRSEAVKNSIELVINKAYEYSVKRWKRILNNRMKLKDMRDLVVQYIQTDNWRYHALDS